MNPKTSSFAYLFVNIYKFLKEFTLYLIPFFLITSTIWVRKNFGEVSFDQILYHINFGAENFLESDRVMVFDFLKKTILVSCILSLLIFCIHHFHLQITRNLLRIKNLLINLPLIKSSLSYFHFKKLPYTLFAFSLTFIAYQYSFISYLNDYVFSSRDDFYAKNYIDPKTVAIKSTHPRNLILIYVEALENTYGNVNLFQQNLIENIQPKMNSGLSFGEQRQLPGTGWTMAGITATQCGVPLKTKFGGDFDHDKNKNKKLENVKDFLPDITCLGDILKNHHYHNVFMGGASLKYAGKGLFFSSHGYDELYGREEILEAYHHQIQTNQWGIYDDDLFKFASTHIDELVKQDKPFNLTLLTVDMHLPNGHISHTCKDRGVNDFKGIVKCTSELTAEFIDELDKKGYLENTTVVIMGDHLAMMNPIFNKLQKVKHRTVFNNYIIKNGSFKKNRNVFIHFDHLPTILDSIGLQVEGGKLGLGISGFFDGKLPDFDARFDDYNKNIMRNSARYQAFWGKK